MVDGGKERRRRKEYIYRSDDDYCTSHQHGYPLVCGRSPSTCQSLSRGGSRANRSVIDIRMLIRITMNMMVRLGWYLALNYH